jgi:hypothetical protein
MPAIDDSTFSAVNNANFKNLADAAAFNIALAYQNAVGHNRAMDQIREAALGSIAKNLVEIDPAQAVSLLKATSGNDLAQQLTALTAALASAQQNVKTGQTTPPTTP